MKPGPVPDLDDADRRLLALLQADGRTSYTELSQQVGLSAPAVKQRVQRLIGEGVLQVVGVSDPQALGFAVSAMVGVIARGDLKAVADEISQIPNVIYLVLTSGEHDLLVEVVCRTQDELLQVVNDRIRRVDGVVETRVWQYFAVHTHRFTWGLPG